MQRVLIVEDDGIQAFVVARILGQQGYEISGPCLTLQQALAALEAHSLDAALLDIGVDDGFSIALADWLTEARIPFGFISGYGPRALPTRYRSQPYLAKPWSDQNLLDVVRATLASVNHDRIAS